MIASKCYSPSVLTLIMTYECTSSCRHCFFECSPRSSVRMDEGVIERIIRESAAFRKISFSGGEPFLHPGTLEKSLSAAAHCGWLKERAVVTNSFWASSRSKSVEILGRLKRAGLNFLVLSCDSYHQQFTPFDHVINAAGAALELEIRLQFNIISPYFEFASQAIPETIAKLSSGLQEEFKERKSVLRHIRLFQGTEIMILMGKTNAAGRALENEADFTRLSHDSPEWEDMCVLHRGGRAASLDGQVLIMLPDYTCFPCCSLYSKEGHLSLGSGSQSSMQHIIERAEENPMLRMIAKIGISAVKSIVDRHFDTYRDRKFTSPCEFCHDLGKNWDISGIFG